MYSLVEDDDINIDMIKEAEWLLSSQYSFMISDKLWPYVNDQTSYYFPQSNSFVPQLKQEKNEK